MTIERYYRQLQQEIIALQESDEEGGSREQLFTHLALDLLADGGETENTTIAYDEKDLGKRGQHKINGFAVSNNYETVDLFISIYRSDDNIETIPKAQIDKAAGLLTNFFKKATYNDYAYDIDESRPIFDFANQLASYDNLRNNLIRVNAFIITNGEYKGAAPESKEINGVMIYYHVFDIRKLYQLSEESRLPIEIDFRNFEGEEFDIPCLPASNYNDDYKAYLAIMPGPCLAKLYEQYGARLLEQNVRTFLQFTGKINKGIRETIINEPHMFFAFNNGITATADHIELDNNNKITKIRNLQIVNGGQTTASIYATAKDKKYKADISDIFVPVKFSIIEKPEQYASIVSRISKYANTQNKVKEADFSSNNPVLIAIEKLSRFIVSPLTPQSNIQTYWFFERARGQYKTKRSREGFTKSQLTAFDKKYPKNQVFTKVDLAKYINAFQEVKNNGKVVIGPHTVVLGNEKNFAVFISDNLPNEKDVNNVFFEDLVAKAILFETAVKRYGTRKNDYNIGDIRQAVVPYTIALLSYLTHNKVDLYKIWKNQTLSDNLSDFLYNLMKQVNDFIIDSSPMSHYIEWAKKEECWAAAKEHDWNVNLEEIKDDLIDENNPPQRRILTDEGVSEEEERNKENLLRSIPFSLWMKIREWGRTSGFLDIRMQGWAQDIAFIIKHGRRFSSLDKNHAIELFDIVFEHNPELLEEADTLAEAENQNNKENPTPQNEEITLELVQRMVEWDRRKRILEDYKWKYMEKVASGRTPLTDRTKSICALNLEKLKRRGFK